LAGFLRSKATRSGRSQLKTVESKSRHRSSTVWLLLIGDDTGTQEESDTEVPFGMEMRLQVFRSLAFLLSRFPEAANVSILARAVDLAKNEQADWTQGMEITQPWRGAHGLVRLLIFHGANPHDILVRNVVLNKSRNAWGRLRGYRDDVLDAVYWKRWLEEQSIGGLPPEIVEMIMLWSWENWCMI